MTLVRLSLAVLAVAAIAAPGAAFAQTATGEVIYVVGAISDPANTDTQADASDANIPVLPVAYENADS